MCKPWLTNPFKLIHLFKALECKWPLWIRQNLFMFSQIAFYRGFFYRYFFFNPLNKIKVARTIWVLTTVLTLKLKSEKRNHKVPLLSWFGFFCVPQPFLQIPRNLGHFSWRKDTISNRGGMRSFFSEGTYFSTCVYVEHNFLGLDWFFGDFFVDKHCPLAARVFHWTISISISFKNQNLS